MAGPLVGIRVLEVGLLIQGPQAAALLGDMGADVVKVELPGFGDQGRYIFLAPGDLRSAVYTACNRGKRSLTLDLRHEAGANVFRRLARDTDVVISNFKPRTLEGWGLGYQELAAENPRLVWAAGSTFGPLGPDAPREGADLAGQVAGGLVRTTGRDGDPPSPVGIFIADHIASLNMVAGVLAALQARHRTGRGQRVEVSLLGGQIWAQASEYTHLLMTGEGAGRSNYGHPMIRVPSYRIFETADGWIGIIGIPPDARDAFYIALERPDLLTDTRVEAPIATPGDMAELRRELESALRRQTTAEWCRRFQEIGVRYAEVRSPEEVLADPGAWENGYFAEVEGPDGERERVVGTPIRLSETPLEPGATAPTLGADSHEILTQAGYSAEEIEALRAEGTV